MFLTASNQNRTGCKILMRKIWIIIKLTVSLLLFFVFRVNAYYHTQKVTIIKKNVPLSEVFKVIEQQTGFLFFYDKELIQKVRPIDIALKDATLQEALSACLKDQQLTYSLVQNTIVITKKKYYKPEMISAVNAMPVPPPVEIKGNVVNMKGEPLQNVSIVVAGTKIGTTTNSSGLFTLSVSDNNNIVLEISTVGYQPKSLHIGNQTEISVKLEELYAGLNEVVVTGYSTQRKKDITGSVAVVDMKAFKSIPTGSASQALQGQASGVNVISSGVPGGRNDIFIRGVTSFGNTQPLVIIDGVQGNWNDLNINDVESMQVLKDAGAASIYGVRGSNGVILITTKKGKSGAPTVSYDSYYGVQLPLSGNVWNLLTPQENAAYVMKLNPSTNLYRNGIPDYTY